MLVGRAVDPDLGELEATAFFNFSPPIEDTAPIPTAEFVSLELVLKFDYYSFGVMDSSQLELAVHELLEPIPFDNFYDSKSVVPYQALPIGDTIISPGPVMLKNGWALASDNDLTNNTYFSAIIKLPATLGQDLLQDLITGGPLIEEFAQFSAKYPGFALKMPSGNKILGFTPVYTLPTPSRLDSRLVLTFKENNNTATRDFPIYYTLQDDIVNSVTSFSQLTEVRSGTVLDGIVPFLDFTPTDGNLYVQSGTGIMPKFSFSKVYEYFDTIPNVVINLAELEIENLYTGRTPEDIEFLLLEDGNQFRPVKIDTVIDGQQKSVDDPYLIKIRTGVVPQGIGIETRVIALNQLTGSSVGVDQETGKVGSTIFTEFFQQIITHKDSYHRAEAFAIHPVENEFNKSVSILKLGPSSATLKVYYSIPTTAPLTSP